MLIVSKVKTPNELIFSKCKEGGTKETINVDGGR